MGDFLPWLDDYDEGVQIDIRKVKRNLTKVSGKACQSDETTLTKSKKLIQIAAWKARFVRKRRGQTGCLAKYPSQTMNMHKTTQPTTIIAIIDAKIIVSVGA